MSTTPAARRRVITRQVVEWAAWDWGSAAFNAVATTFVFTTYLTSDGVFTDSGTASTWLSNGMTIAGLFIALLAPITGQRADRRGRGRPRPEEPNRDRKRPSEDAATRVKWVAGLSAPAAGPAGPHGPYATPSCHGPSVTVKTIGGGNQRA